MGIIKGLGKMTAHLDEQERKFGDDDRPRARWFKIAANSAVKVRFLQELDPNSENYSEEAGLGFLAVEHSAPHNFRRKAQCTIDDEGACYACEQHQLDFKAGWNQKTRLYINVLVDDGIDEPFVAVLSQGNGPKSITPALMEQASEMGTITDRWFKIKRSGAGPKDTSYLLTPLKNLSDDEQAQTHELYDLEKALLYVSYADQPKFYGQSEAPAPVAEPEEVMQDAAW